jgi:hypothetical protein
MNFSKKLFLIAALGLGLQVNISAEDAPNHTIDQEQTTSQNKSTEKKLYFAYMKSLLMSGCIGAVTGGAAGYILKKNDCKDPLPYLLIMAFFWSLESELRSQIIDGLQKDLDACGIDHKKNFMFNGARLASWLAYLYV